MRKILPKIYSFVSYVTRFFSIKILIKILQQPGTTFCNQDLGKRKELKESKIIKMKRHVLNLKLMLKLADSFHQVMSMLFYLYEIYEVHHVF